MVDRVARFLEITSPSSEVATLDEMQQRMTGGEGLPAICKAWDVPFSRVMNWLMADEKRYAIYDRALEVGSHAEMAEVVPLSDEAAKLVAAGAKPAAVTAKTLQIDTRFRKAQFHAREKYGEKAQQGAVLPHVQINIGVRSGAGGAPAVTVEGDIGNEVDDGI